MAHNSHLQCCLVWKADYFNPLFGQSKDVVNYLCLLSSVVLAEPPSSAKSLCSTTFLPLVLGKKTAALFLVAFKRDSGHSGSSGTGHISIRAWSVVKSCHDSRDSLIPAVTFSGWSVSPTLTIPRCATPHSCCGWSHRISRECPFPDSCRGLWLISLFVATPFHLQSSLVPPLLCYFLLTVIIILLWVYLAPFKIPKVLYIALSVYSHPIYTNGGELHV